MFINRLKSQYYIWCILAFGIGFPNILSNILSLNIVALIVNAIMVAGLAFIFYCVWYPLGLLFRRFRNRKSIIVLLLFLFTITSFVQPQSADANWKEVIKRHAKPVGIFMLGVIVNDKADDAWDAIEEAISDPIYRFNYWTMDVIRDTYDWLTAEEEYEYSINCSQCSYVFRTNDLDEYMRRGATGVCHDDYQPYNPN